MNYKSFNLILADDDTDDCAFFKEALEDCALATNLQTVHDGEQLMSLLASGTTDRPLVIFLDLNMPRKNGFECLSEIKNDKDLKELPVVIFSTSMEKDMVSMLYENGAIYYIRKPSDFKELKKIILETLIRLSEVKSSQENRENFVLTPQSRSVNYETFNDKLWNL